MSTENKYGVLYITRHSDFVSKAHYLNIVKHNHLQHSIICNFWYRFVNYTACYSV